MFGCCPARSESHESPSSAASAANVALPEVTEGSEEGFRDLTFAIVEVRGEPTGTQRIVAQGKHHGQIVGFVVVLQSGWSEKDFLPEKPGHLGLVRIESVGKSSDHLIRAMDGIYEARLGVTTFRNAVAADAFALEGNPSELADGPVKLKLFFQSEKEDEYAEVYLNIDVAGGTVELREKDVEYRAPLLRSLSEAP